MKIKTEILEVILLVTQNATLFIIALPVFVFASPAQQPVIILRGHPKIG